MCVCVGRGVFDSFHFTKDYEYTRSRFRLVGQTPNGQTNVLFVDFGQSFAESTRLLFQPHDQIGLVFKRFLAFLKFTGKVNMVNKEFLNALWFRLAAAATTATAGWMMAAPLI